MMRKSIALLLPLFVTGLVLTLAGGCKGGGASATAVANSYVGLMKNEKYEEAAKMWDYETQARKDNEDWDNIQEGQRKLILDKVAGDKVASLKLWSGYFPSETKVTQVQESGDTAIAQLDGGRVKHLELVKMRDQWKVSGMD